MTALAMSAIDGAILGGKGQDLPSGEWEVPGALEKLEDDRLMLLAKEGHRPAFNTLVRRHQCAALEVARKQLGSIDLAKDAAQITFVEIYNYIPKYRPEGKFKQLLYRILLNRCRMTFRSRRRAQDMKARLSSVEPLRAPLPDEQLAHKEQRARLELAIRDLSPKLRDVLVLRLSNELSYDEIADILSIPVGTVKSRLNQGQKKLREALEG